jgi:hypothetical protein
VELVWVALGAAVLLAAFKVGRQAERDHAREERRRLQQEQLDLGTLGPIAAMMVMGDLTPEQADREVKIAAIMRPSAERMWNGMSSEDRQKLGRDMIALQSDPTFAKQQGALVEELKSADPEAWQKAERAFRARDKVSRVERRMGPLDPLTRDLIQLSEIDPEGYAEILKKLKARAAGASEDQLSTP